MCDSIIEADRSGYRMDAVQWGRTLGDVAGDELLARGIELRQLRPGTVVNVHTRHSLYRCVVVDGATGTVRLQNGTPPAADACARIDGSTTGGSVLKTGWIVPGLRLDMRVGERRTVTSAIVSIDLQDS